MRTDIEMTYYHVYNRGINRQRIFRDDEDYVFFSSLFARHLGTKTVTDKSGRPYVNLRDAVEVISYCWMPNHFHLLIYQKEEGAVRELLARVCTAYTMYFNKKYARRGPLYESNYKASMILSDAYLQHISRYIHLNPDAYKRWPYSSYAAYCGSEAPSEWLARERLFENIPIQEKDYSSFVADYESARAVLQELKHQLADC